MHARFRIPIQGVKFVSQQMGLCVFRCAVSAAHFFIIKVSVGVQLWEYGTNCKKYNGEQICTRSKINERGHCNEKNNITYDMYIVFVMRMYPKTETG